MTTTLTIEVAETDRSRAKYTAWHDDAEIVTATTQPLLDAARVLLDRGIAQPDDEIRMVTRGGHTVRAYGRAGKLARLTVCVYSGFRSYRGARGRT